MKLFENRTVGNYIEGSPIVAYVTRTKTPANNVYWLIKSPFKRTAAYTDTVTFELKTGPVYVVYKYSKWTVEKFMVPADPENDEAIL